MNNFIPEVEINTSNICGANCYMCAKSHGCGNVPFMQPQVFDTLIEQLKDCKVGQFQTSGNGECLLNPNFINYLRKLKKNFPNVERWCYNNFSLMDRATGSEIINERMITKMHTRVESLNPVIMQMASRLNPEIVFRNIENWYRLTPKDEVHLVILYNNPGDYYWKCMNVLDKEPAYWPYGSLRGFKNEMEDIKNYFQQFTRVPIDIFKIDHCLWAERETAEPDPETPCPKMNVLENVVWVSPNGNIQGCCYDDRQSDFTLGNIMHEHILDIYNGKKRRDLLNQIRKREIKNYPCVNPKCCDFHAK